MAEKSGFPLWFSQQLGCGRWQGNAVQSRLKTGNCSAERFCFQIKRESELSSRGDRKKYVLCIFFNNLNVYFNFQDNALKKIKTLRSLKYIKYIHRKVEMLLKIFKPCKNHSLFSL